MTQPTNVGNPSADPSQFQLSHYDFDLPESLIAQVPIEPRDHSRLMIVDRASGAITHAQFKDLAHLMPSSALLVANNTPVIRARLLGKRVLPTGLGGAVEFLMLEKLGDLRWEGAFRATAKHVAGVVFEVAAPTGPAIRGTLISGSKDSPHGTVVVEFDRDPVSAGAGEIPLPPYIERVPNSSDQERYQTVYAKSDQGPSAAAPTAGLHFTPELLAYLKERGVDWCEVTLQVGLGTFRPVKAENIRDHVMHDEAYLVPELTSKTVNQARKSGKPVIAIGTTSVRTLESAWSPDGGLKAGVGRTQIFIYPGYTFKVVDQLITNFHLPKSTLMMMISAFAGRDLVMKAYKEAVAQKYRFFSYGDAMWIR